ncbi:sigma-70 family RNA polymerase sigma factor [Neptunicella sp. SCSIO 80796]|uniref:sigma-70 family RNA polymerase sigma factor n=1 Tax=Neptunicella plasticusilytica TaxID=3117012 RepID=UPI003A4D522B
MIDQNKQAEPDVEALIIAIAQHQDRHAFIQLFNATSAKLKGYARRCGASDSDAEEIVQECFITIWNKAQQFDPAKASAITWLFRIIRNKRIDFLRKERPEQIQSYDIFPEFSGQLLESSLESDLDRNITRILIDSLPDEQRQLIYYVYFEDKSHSEIALALDIPLGTIKSRLRLAMKKLDTLAKENMTWLIIILLTNF